jgi:hypothetical protein
MKDIYLELERKLKCENNKFTNIQKDIFFRAFVPIHEIFDIRQECINTYVI